MSVAVKAWISDELGLTADDLARLYGVGLSALDDHLVSMGETDQIIYERVLGDIDAVRIGYRQITISQENITVMRDLLSTYIFHPLVSMNRAGGELGWRLSGDDAQFVAFRMADIVNIDFEWSDILRLRLNRLVIWPDENAPETNQKFRDRVVDVTTYLAELSGVL
jgi:hypothetical protein